MSDQQCWKNLLPFGLTLIAGFFAVALFQSENENAVEKKVAIYNEINSSKKMGRGTSGACFGRGKTDFGATETEKQIQKTASKTTKAIQIVSKPKANYTDTARQNNIQGAVTLRVTFLANGSIGSMSVVDGLPDGLTERALASAREIKFQPAEKGGVPYTVTRTVHYNFTLY